MLYLKIKLSPFYWEIIKSFVSRLLENDANFILNTKKICNCNIWNIIETICRSNRLTSKL